jgi:hypothetical protein
MSGRIKGKDDEDELVLVFTAFTKGGAWVLAKRYRDKLGAMILQEPIESEDDVWVFMVSNPFIPGLALP